jgi:prepilin-type N-terminal cleavage/methylation domain-containing protein
MLTYLQRARYKKGFTVVELVITIGIIAIMASVAVPNAVAYQRRSDAREHNEHATTFYLALQQTLLSVMEFDNTPHEFTWNTRQRVTGTDAIAKSTGASFFLYVTRSSGTIEGHMTLNAAAHDIANLGNHDAGNDEVFKLFMDELNGYMKNATDGHYYALFDSSFRVTAVYFSRHVALAGIGAGTARGTFLRDNRLPCGRAFGAYPTFYGMIGSYNCRGPAVASCGHSRANGRWFDTNIVCVDNIGYVRI